MSIWIRSFLGIKATPRMLILFKKGGTLILEISFFSPSYTEDINFSFQWKDKRNWYLCENVKQKGTSREIHCTACPSRLCSQVGLFRITIFPQNKISFSPLPNTNHGPHGVLFWVKLPFFLPWLQCFSLFWRLFSLHLIGGFDDGSASCQLWDKSTL